MGERDGPHLRDGLDWAPGPEGRSESSKLRGVLHCLLVKHFGRESACA